jgi:hypothetical protein
VGDDRIFRNGMTENERKDDIKIDHLGIFRHLSKRDIVYNVFEDRFQCFTEFQKTTGEIRMEENGRFTCHPLFYFRIHASQTFEMEKYPPSPPK